MGVVTTCTTSSTAAGGSLGLRALHRRREAGFQNDHPKIRALGRRAFGREIGAVCVAPAGFLKPLDSELFELVFGDHF